MNMCDAEAKRLGLKFGNNKSAVMILNYDEKEELNRKEFGVKKVDTYK